MFIVCESIARGMEHAPFNAALLRTILCAFPNENVNFFAENYHLASVREQIGEESFGSVVWKKLILPARHSGFYTRLFSDFKTIRFLLDQLNENPQKDVLVITGNASILWALKYYLGTNHKDKKVQVILHGDFSTLHRTPRKSILNPFYYLGSLKTSLKLSGYKRIQHLVLEESIRDAIIKVMPFLENNIGVLDHPIPVDGYHLEIKNWDTPVQFGFLGRASEKKGFSKYLNVVCEISKQFSGRVKFHLIGRVSDKLKRANYSKIEFLSNIPTAERISRDEYVNRLKNLHFVCLFFDEYYECCASGVLMDSIAWCKPIIATQLSIFTAIQEKYGDIGYLCRNNEISETISSIIRTSDSKRYKHQVLNMSQVRASRTPETLAAKYRELVNCL